MKHFFEFPNRWYHVREMARLLKLNPTTASKYLNNFAIENILIKKEERDHLLFKANTDEIAFKDEKIHFNIKSLRESNLIEYVEKELHFPQTIILFGSYAKGENDEQSDIDIFVIAQKKKQLQLSDFEKRLSKKIQLIVKTNMEFIAMQKDNKNLANSIINGIILKGYLEVFV